MAITAPNHASSPQWIPEDDLLLKNSIEAGASLEALAKGAVQFSRRFTFHELRDRWHSLLYDPDVSTQASSRIMELELSGSNSSSKISRPDNAKSSGVTAKRKMVSIRRQYNAMRKRLRSELFNSGDIGFLEPHMHDSNGHAGDFHEHVTLDNGPGDANCMLHDSISDHFGLQDSDFDILNRVFPQEAEDVGTTTVVDDPANVYQTQCQNLFDDNDSIPNMREDNLYGFPENVPPLIGHDGRHSSESKVGHKAVSHMLADGSVDFGKITNSNIQVPLQELPNDKHFEANNSNMKRPPALQSTNETPQTGSGFAGRHISSPDSDGSVSLHAMGFSSSMSRLPIWKTMEDISVPAMPVHMHNEEVSPGVEGASALPRNSEQRGKSPSRFDIVHSGPLLRDSDNGNCFSSGAVSEGEFVDLSDSLLNFPTEDELIFMNVDGKEKMDKSSYDNVNTLIVSSGGDAQEGGLCNIEPNELNNVESCTLVSSACRGISSPSPIESENVSLSFNDNCQQSILPSEMNIASTSVLHPDYSELQFIEENICCVLNTEDTEIPCNDDIFLLIHPTTSFAPARKLYTTDPTDPVSSADEKDNERGVKLAKEKDPAVSHASSSAIGTQKLTESFHGLPTGVCKVTSQIPDTKSLILKPGEVGKTFRDFQNRSAVATNVPIAHTADRVPEQDVIKVESKVSNNPSTSREPAVIAEAGSVEIALPKSVDNPSASDQDESESEYDVPYSSDIEAMILEMDLGPHDQDSHSTRQDEDAKKKIIRLEQCAQASLQRMMSSHGALAFLYGRHLKHYITKPEVLLGRSTDDVDVDIDLRKEGRANKISRRQATIKMETNGSFFLKNLGKSSISVNGKAVASEQSLHLSSSSLIEIKGMSFVFEINHKYVRRYLDTIVKGANIRTANTNGRVDMKLDWSC